MYQLKHGNWIRNVCVCVCVLPAAYFLLLFAFFLILCNFFFCVFPPHRLRAWFQSAAKRWVSEVIHIMMCTVVCSGWKADSCAWARGNGKIFCVHCSFGYAVVVLRVCARVQVCVSVCVLTLRSIHIYISVEWERLTVKWGLATILNFMLYAFLLHVTVLRCMVWLHHLTRWRFDCM